jgi:hypothetical protein
LRKLELENIYKYFLQAVMSLFALTISGCDAPRLNPFDPENPEYSYVTIQGTVQTFSLPYQNIPSVSVLWVPSNIIVNTDNTGNFKISNILPVNGNLIFQKNGYLPDTINITWANQKILNFQINMSSIPLLDSISIYTVVINEFTPPGLVSELAINAKILDNNNDLDTVFVENQQLNLKTPLGYDAANKIYKAGLSTQQLNVSDMEETIGLDFSIITEDIFGREFNIGNSKVTRVIESGVSIQFPANDTTVSSTPLFTWQRFKAGYAFSYMIQIFTNDISNPQKVFTAQNISSDSVSYQLTSPLSNRDYYWVIWVIDQFQNRSQSLPATFIVN